MFDNPHILLISYQEKKPAVTASNPVVKSVSKTAAVKAKKKVLRDNHHTFSRFDHTSEVYCSVTSHEVFLCFVAIVRVRVYYVDFFVFFVLHHW